MAPIVIEPVSELHLEALSALLVEAVAGGGSVGFMDPLAPEAAREFWRGALASAARGERVILGAFLEGELLGSVSLFLGMPPNQPHRAEIGKLLTKAAWRGRGIATALMAMAEMEAETRGRRLLLLDTAEEGGAAGLYEKLGYVRAGLIPDYALKPQGGLTGTILLYKRLAPAA